MTRFDTGGAESVRIVGRASRDTWPLAFAFVTVGGLFVWAVIASMPVGSSGPSSMPSDPTGPLLATALAPLAWTETPTATATGTATPKPTATTIPQTSTFLDRFGYCPNDLDQAEPKSICVPPPAATTPTPIPTCTPDWSARPYVCRVPERPDFSAEQETQ